MRSPRFTAAWLLPAALLAALIEDLDGLALELVEAAAR